MNGGIAQSPITFDLSEASLGGTPKDTLRDSYEGPSKENCSPAPRVLPQPPSKPTTNTSSSTAMPPSRSGTLSWQQRPTSRGSTGPRARPLSQIATENSTSRSPRASADPPSTGERELSREQIADSLGSKDPAWFRQTHERGLGSAAYRRNQEESMSDTASLAGLRLPGMSRESTMEPERQGSPVSESVRSISPSRTDSMRGTSIRHPPYTNATSVSSSDRTRPPIPSFASPSFEPPASDTSSRGMDPLFNRGMAMSPSQGRISPERIDRPSSPTKGLGGFVQSAMLKRSDSVNKRWSAQPGIGLSRGNSIASNRSGYEGPKYSIPSLNAPKEQLSSTPSREASPLSSSRPGSSHGPATFARIGKDNDKPSFPPSTDALRPTPVFDVEPDKLVRSREVLPSNVPEVNEEMEPVAATHNSPPSSPTKRWSPTKSSWLENAINKPDSPKPKMPPPQQPSWMTNLNQAKQQRGSVDLGKRGSFKYVSTSGLLRSPPMGAANKPPSIGGLPPGFRAGVTTKSKSNVDERFSNVSENQSTKVEAVDKRESTPEPKPESPGTRRLIESASSEAEPTTVDSPKPSEDVSTASTGRNQESSPRSMKPKPETPPKKDFRSNLKPRQTSGEKKSTEDPEFRNVFGKLKRTQTQNYVAPDELKDNILRGKAGLAVTGGPKKTERRDEFKESLLKQKEAMKAGPSPTTGRKPSIGVTIKDQTSSTPEALAKRNGLTKSDSNPNIPRTNGNQSKPQPEALAKFNSLRGKPQSASSEVPPRDAGQAQKRLSVNGRPGTDFNSSLASVLSRGPAPLAGASSSSQKTRLEDSQADDVTRGQDPSPEATEGPQLTHMTKSRARGPKRRLPTTSAGTEERTAQKTSSPATANPMLSSLGTDQLGSTSTRQGETSTSPTTTDPQPPSVGSISNNHRKSSQPQPPRKPSLNFNKPDASNPVPADIKNAPTKPESLRIVSPPPTKPKPLSPEADRVRRPLSSTPEISNIPSRTPQAHNHRDKLTEPQQRKSQAQSTPEENAPLPSVKSAAASWTTSERKDQPAGTRARSPIKLPTRKDEEAAMQDAGLILRKEAPIGLGIETVKQEARTYAPAMRDLPTPPLASPKSPPIPAKKPPSIATRVVSNTTVTESPSKVNGSPPPQTSEAARLFAELFDESPTTNFKVNIDTPAVLASRASTSEPDKIRTLRKQLWEVTPGGKLIPVSSDQSHIMFEDGLYICHHVFGSASGTRTTEVYLWCGDGVASSAVEDAQIFARKEAKDHGGKLIVLQQGKETSRFFQALGGIVITRHGQSDRASSRYMLCGRRHVGQIAFDEVDFLPQSLCRGYPYIISSGSGKVHLWKGIGSGIDELGCARLIGMDLGVRGEIEEVEDGKELEAFWKLFPNGGEQRPGNISPAPSKHWHLKPSIEQYSTRLYQVDLEPPRPKSSSSFWGRRGSAPAPTPTDESAPKWNALIKEIAPFAQSDIFYDGVFVLDTFFEVFV